MNRDTEIPFDQFKSESIEKVDELVKEKIIAGFEFDGKLFSMSIEAQLNWSNLFLIPESVFPLSINTKNDEVYILTFENRASFYQSAMQHKMNLLMTGTNIKNNIKNISSIEEINDIISGLVQ